MKDKYLSIMNNDSQVIEKIKKLSQYQEEEANRLIIKLIENNLSEKNSLFLMKIDGFLFYAAENLLIGDLCENIVNLFEKNNCQQYLNIHNKVSNIYSSFNYYLEKKLLKSPSEALRLKWFYYLDKQFTITQDVRCKLDKGLYLYRNDEFDAALPYFKKGAEINCAESMQLLGLYHEQGLGGVEKSLFKAAQWNIRSGFKGNVHHDLELWIEDDELDCVRFGDCNIKKVSDHLLAVTPAQRLVLVELLNKVELSHQ
jgi:TPR repeat protein